MKFIVICLIFAFGLLIGLFINQRETFNLMYNRDAWREFAISKSQGSAKDLDGYIKERAESMRREK